MTFEPSEIIVNEPCQQRGRTNVSSLLNTLLFAIHIRYVGWCLPHHVQLSNSLLCSVTETLVCTHGCLRNQGMKTCICAGHARIHLPLYFNKYLGFFLSLFRLSNMLFGKGVDFFLPETFDNGSRGKVREIFFLITCLARQVVIYTK